MAEKPSPSASTSSQSSLPHPDRPHSRSVSHSNKSLQRIFSASHIDDQSLYHNNEDPTADGHVDGTLKRDIDATRALTDGSSNDIDLEAPQLEKTSTSKSKKDPNLVSWEGLDDPQNPMNWSKGRKWAATLVVSSFTFISPVSSSMVAPSLNAMAQEFDIQNEVESQMILAVFVLAYAVGPLFYGPMSEIYGRVVVLQLANLFYLIFNLACGFAQNKVEMIVFRFLSGLGGSAPLAIGGGVLSDCWRADERGRSIAVYSLAPLLGPALGPLVGSFITENTTWRWTFYATSIADAFIQAFGLFFLRETYPPRLLHWKARRLRMETGNPALRTEFEQPERSFTKLLKGNLVRPFKMLATQPIIQVLTLYMAFLYGLMYLVLSTFPLLWTGRYHEKLGVAGLNYISIGVGFTLGTQIASPLNDRIYRLLKKRNNGVGQPEFRIPLMNVGSTLVPIGLFIYAWTSQNEVHWIAPSIGAAIFSLGMIIGYQCIQTYVVDAYTQYAASAVGSLTVLRSLAGFGFPLFAPYMYDALDFGWGNSLLGFVAVALGIPAPILLWTYGKTLREKSPYAAGG